MIGFMDAIQRPWEDYFTVVQWDQRQTGKSYYPADDENQPLTVNQFIDDTEEVIQYLRDYLNKDKLFVLGHSWGTVLGMHMVKRHPDWLHAYIGVGHVVGGLANERAMWARLMMHAKNNNEHEIISRLEEVIPLLDADSPEREKHFLKSAAFVRRELSRLAGEALMHHSVYDDIASMDALERSISPHLTLTDLSHSIIGDEPALERDLTFTKQVLDNDLPNDLGNSFEVPIFFFSGAHDWHTPISLSDKWFGHIKAPYKELIHFEESSHFVVNEEPGKFLIALVNSVLPFAQDGITRVDNNV